MACLSSTIAYSVLANGLHVELKIICQDGHFLVHREVICARSLYFQLIVDAGINDAAFEVERHTIQLMLEWLYCKQYIGPPISNEAWAAFGCGTNTEPDILNQARLQGTVITDEALKHAVLLRLKVCALATRLGIEELRIHLSQYFWENTAACITRGLLQEILSELCSLTSMDDYLVCLPLAGAYFWQFVI